MQIGTQFSQPALGLPPRNAVVAYTRLVEATADAGFESFWAGQHFLPGDYQLFQPLPLLARLSAAAPTLALGTSVILLPLLNPLDVAEQASAIDAMAGGGFQLGVGLGYRRLEFEASGIPWGEADTRFEESVELIRRLWSGAETDFDGTHFRLAGGRINPAPRVEADTPILIGAYSERAVERAGRIGDGWIVPPELVGDALTRRLEIFRNAARDSSRAGTIVLMRPFHVTRDREEREHVDELLARHFGLKRSWGLKKGGDDTRDPSADARAASVIGTPQECVETIQGICREVAPAHLILLMGFRGTDDAALRASIELAGEAVLPPLRAFAPKQAEPTSTEPE
jgi:alkanesulfonate monooxygenase SsuD/methylene tetrahydromethanopterin reductase-like flavin-dependent oxidoreductase (luciferase family)